MNIFERNPVESIKDIVFDSTAVRHRIESIAYVKKPNPTLFYGAAGVGKTSLCNVIAEELVGPGHKPDIKTINVPLFSSKAALCDQILSHNGFGIVSGIGKSIIILEELDGADLKAQLALKVLVEEQAKHKLFFATTNDLSLIIQPIRSRFDKILIKQADARHWLRRAQSILRNEGVNVPDKNCLKLLQDFGQGADGREIMHLLDRFAQHVLAP